ncbi:MAG TPA: lysophospholipid acyltransferase family protein [Candidatus Dormibacteraeota bacterium]|jgi:1-acyl-sn-glycerol-3-phosphate acyltransferase
MTDTGAELRSPQGGPGGSPGEARAADDAASDSLELAGAVVLRPRRTAGTRRSRPARSEEVGARLRRLHAATTDELERRRTEGIEPADSVPVPVDVLSSVTRDLPALLSRTAHAALDTVTSLRPERALQLGAAGVAFLAKQRELARRQAECADSIDEFGFDREWTESLLPFFRFLYRDYWRVQVRGLENVPVEGAALLVSNHAGVLPYDGVMIRTAIFEDLPGQRHARALILNAFFGVPVASWFLRRTGNTLAHPDDAERLLRAGELVLVFPEGAKGTGKLYRERYRLRRFGRGGFVQTALRTGSPIVPVSVVGSEELHPMLANLDVAARALGLPYFPLTPSFPWLGLLGLIPLPSSWIIEFHPPLDPAAEGLGAGAADDMATVMQLTDRVRETIQQGVYMNLTRRGSVFAEPLTED